MYPIYHTNTKLFDAEDIKTLKNLGVTKEKEIAEIQLAVFHTNIYAQDGNEPKKKVNHLTAVELLGRAGYLAGIQRCCYHRSACKSVDGDPNLVFYFESAA